MFCRASDRFAGLVGGDIIAKILVFDHPILIDAAVYLAADRYRCQGDEGAGSHANSPQKYLDRLHVVSPFSTNLLASSEFVTGGSNFNPFKCAAISITH